MYILWQVILLLKVKFITPFNAKYLEVKFCISICPISLLFSSNAYFFFLKLKVFLNDLGEKGELLGFLLLEDRDV